MITPTKGIAPQRSLLAVGAQVLSVLEGQPLSVSQTWSRLRRWRASNGHLSPVPFWWYVLSLDVLFSLGLVEFDGELLVRRNARAA
ncbi:ABC-three component system middle component 6 [Micromonospora palythoicola]|uniref:ABC-three component system middle component 6 n=1 Tax=Micromonospora palythoicola TaxID=3120507 RepID=UPI002FCE2651